MEYTNALSKAKAAYWGSDVWDEAISNLLLLLAPITPHMAEELWASLGKPYSVHQQAWPAWDEAMLVEETDRDSRSDQRQGARSRHRRAQMRTKRPSRPPRWPMPTSSATSKGKQVIKVIVPRGQIGQHRGEVATPILQTSQPPNHALGGCSFSGQAS